MRRLAIRERVEALAAACGARPLAMTASDHDAAAAAISHLPLVVATALVEAVAGHGDARDRPDWPAAAALAAGGWTGMTRLARGDEAMGAGIIATNGPAIAARLRDLRGGDRQLVGRAGSGRRPGRCSDHRAAESRPATAGGAWVSADELVFVVPRHAVIDSGAWHGIRSADLDDFLATIERHGQFQPRAAMEADPGFKQIIPYLVLRRDEHYFLMRRTRAGGDARLHDRWSIGVGGHLNPGDENLDGGLRREWAEELVADFVPEFGFVGLLNDDTTAVGQVHLGAVFVADAMDRAVAIRETDKLSGRFATPVEVAAVAPDLESWSRLVFEFLEVPQEDRPSDGASRPSVA